MGESPEFERPATPETGDEIFTAEEKNELYLERNKYLLEQLGTDLLTGLKNRRFFDQELGKALKAIHLKEDHGRSGPKPLREFSLLFIDLDTFKRVNDKFGHLAGDSVLKEVAGIITTSVREDDVVARFGGDEFYVLLPRTNEDSALTVAEKIRANLEKDIELMKFGVTASIGVRSVDQSNAAKPETLIEHADKAAYKAKEAGKNTVKVYSS